MSELRILEPEILRAYLEESGLEYAQNSISYIFTCPRCNKRKKLYISKRSGRFVCFRCQETDNFKGKPEYALAELVGCSVAEVQQHLYGEVLTSCDMLLDIQLRDYFGEFDEVDEDAFEMEKVNWPYDYYPLNAPEAKRGRDYLANRGIGVNLAMRYDLRYCPEQRRVYFPVASEGRIYGWQGRLIVPHRIFDEEEGEYIEVPKILSSREMQRERLLMFADRLKGSDHAVLCEGPVDALKAHYCGGNVATMGKAVSREQVELLRNCGVKRVYLALDPDAAEEMNRLVETLGGDVELFEMVPDGAKMDLGAMSYEEVYKLFLNAPRISPGRLFIFLDPEIK